MESEARRTAPRTPENLAVICLSLDTPSAVAVEREIRRQSVRDEAVERVGYGNQATSLRMSARLKRMGASNANTMGYINAASTIMSNGSDIYAGLPRMTKPVGTPVQKSSL